MDKNQFQYEGVTPNEIAEMIRELGLHGTSVQDQGNGIYAVSGHGISATAAYNGGDLLVTVTKKPFYIPLGAIQSGINVALGIKQDNTAQKAPSKFFIPGTPIVTVPVPQPPVQGNPETAQGEGLVHPPANSMYQKVEDKT